MTIYTTLAHEVISQLGEGRGKVEQAIADDDEQTAPVRYRADLYG